MEKYFRLEHSRVCCLFCAQMHKTLSKASQIAKAEHQLIFLYEFFVGIFAFPFIDLRKLKVIFKWKSFNDSNKRHECDDIQ